MQIIVESPILETPRVAQLRGLFDLPREETNRLEWSVELPLAVKPWSIGLITGPSGCGKSTIARHLWPAQMALVGSLRWPADRAVIDAFPSALSIKTITGLLSSVGFSSPPAWLRPFGVLSTGQQFRATLARVLAESSSLIVFDEYTSVVDRTVAQIGSAALARTVRQQKQQFVAVTCHEDVEEWLQPDWVYRPAENRFDWRCLQRRPKIHLEISRCESSLWELFAPHHYLSTSLAKSATCFVAHWRGRPVAFSAWLPFVGSGPLARREHRTVTLPDYQGVGIGHAMSTLVASVWRALGYRALSTTTHPSYIQSRRRSPFWVLRRAPSLAASHERSGLKHATTRLTAGFEYTGPALAPRLARRLLQG
jgi:ABC-type lipoprotein export system ATPase subunit